jgi:hypothetical protein
MSTSNDNKKIKDLLKDLEPCKMSIVDFMTNLKLKKKLIEEPQINNFNNQKG